MITKFFFLCMQINKIKYKVKLENETIINLKLLLNFITHILYIIYRTLQILEHDFRILKHLFRILTLYFRTL